MGSYGLFAASAILLFAFIYYARSRTTTGRGPSSLPEPPHAQASIPIVGHILGLMKSKFNYYVQLSQKIPSSVFTMSMPGQKMYIVTKPDVILAVQKQPKLWAAPPIAAKFSDKICGVSDHAHQTLLKNVNGDDGDWGLSMETFAMLHQSLKPGPGLDAMNRIMVNSLDTHLNELEASPPNKSKTIKLVDWLRRSVTLATTNSVYGPQNPYKDNEIADAFWAFESDMMQILLGLFPSWTAAKGIAGRNKVARAFEAYFKAGGHKQGSELVQKRYETASRHDISVADISRYELGGGVAVLVNTTPAIFWMIFLVYSHPTLLEEIREEIAPLVTTKDNEDGSQVRQVDVTDLKENCPLLVSTLQETLRFRSMGTSVRQVMKDSTLQNKWFLEKDSMIQMPSIIVHRDESIWGSTAAEFEPRRFMKGAQPSGGKRPSPSAFRAFGGGTTLCPGRHFATNEILVTVVMFALRYDLRPVSNSSDDGGTAAAAGAGAWVMPTVEKTNVAAVIMEPDTDMDVEVTPRKGLPAKVRWEFTIRDSAKVFAMVAEDHA